MDLNSYYALQYWMGVKTRKPLSVRSIATFRSPEAIESKLEQIGFRVVDECTIVSDSKFWNRRTYVLGDQVVQISEDTGEAYFRDPVITVYGTGKTIDSIMKLL
tara:strand:- start:212 stop:523 length:312 start_codon:yes stop_codon:yes gene_type:complete